VLAFGIRVRGFKPGRIFRTKKSSACLSSEGHVKEPNSDVEVATFGKFLGYFSPIVPPSAAGVPRVVSDARDTLWRELERSNHLSSKLGV